MNKTKIVDKIFEVIKALPHCKIYTAKHIKKVRAEFNYDSLSDISIFAVNCIGGEIYSLLGLKFLSPLINVTIERIDFITLCSRLKEYLALSINVEYHSEEGCTGTLGGGETDLQEIKIRFIHDTDPEEVKEKWSRRCERVNYEKLVFILDDKKLTDANYKAFDKIPAFRKICLTAKDMHEKYPWCYQLKKYKKKDCTGPYNGKSLRGLWKFTEIWDYVSFLNGESN